MPNPHPSAQSASTDDLPAFLRFTPVPVKARRDGWTAELQVRFILHLARGSGVMEAARLLGRSAQGVYRLRERPGAESFAAAWDAACRFADEVRGAPSMPGGRGGSGLETLLVPRFYRGRLIGFVQRDDVTGLMARLSGLDRMADRLDAPGDAPKERAAGRPG